MNNKIVFDIPNVYTCEIMLFICLYRAAVWIGVIRYCQFTFKVYELLGGKI